MFHIHSKQKVRVSWVGGVASRATDWTIHHKYSMKSSTSCYVGVKPWEGSLVKLYESGLRPTKSTHPLLQETAESAGVTPVSWTTLSPHLHPLGAGVPQARAERKCWQIDSLCALTCLLAKERNCHIVDFAGGTGPLGLPLAAMVPGVRVTIVDIKRRSLDIAKQRATAAGLDNVDFFEGDIRAFTEPFDIGVALHACGDASDLVIERCVEANARWVVCPCCTGKLSESRTNVFRFAVTGDNASRISYPRSAAVAKVLAAEAYDFLACAADVSDAHLLAGDRGCLRRLCKSYLEMDRQEWAREHGYACHVTRMARTEASPKADILYGWPLERPPSDAVDLALLSHYSSSSESDEAMAAALRLGFGSANPAQPEQGQINECASADQTLGTGKKESQSPPLCGDASDSVGTASSGKATAKVSSSSPASHLGGALGASEWTDQELEDMQSTLREMKPGDSLDLRLCNPRRRRLAHYTAQELGLEHETIQKGVVRVKCPLSVASIDIAGPPAAVLS